MAFRDFRSLRSVTFPGCVTSMGERAFDEGVALIRLSPPVFSLYQRPESE